MALNHSPAQRTVNRVRQAQTALSNACEEMRNANKEYAEMLGIQTGPPVAPIKVLIDEQGTEGALPTPAYPFDDTTFDQGVAGAAAVVTAWEANAGYVRKTQA